MELYHHRFSHIEKDHLVKLMKQLIIHMAPSRGISGSTPPTAADVPTLLGTGAFSLLGCTQNEVKTDVKPLPAYLRWPHMQADQVRGIGLREIGGGFPKHHRAPSVKFACYAIAKPSTMVQKMQDIKRLRGHRDAVYCGMLVASCFTEEKQVESERKKLNLLKSIEPHVTRTKSFTRVIDEQETNSLSMILSTNQEQVIFNSYFRKQISCPEILGSPFTDIVNKSDPSCLHPSALNLPLAYGVGWVSLGQVGYGSMGHSSNRSSFRNGSKGSGQISWARFARFTA
ncbi:Bromodomain-containing protein [Artemisia annua]|uniref:Bromodomain-containing protein n=1 Tax=Artemisia annua TaxID=35608 RepID=A0A2U1Q2Z8_ARTAN|nr:Bromodomain-containing protein [Artemisia annua]